ncbi:hypothetical protein H920_03536 [Fukomys damarensis]|uniref:Uncharacterized protein n=1 Tax=Fukomys damarensis TaxID=885580 RepID=A0A091DS92_FUKDA|nr:hypothetical protein H920_03536 [Fukomys damarensis]
MNHSFADGWLQAGVSLSTLQDQGNLNGLLEATLDDLLLIILLAGWSMLCFMQKDMTVYSELYQHKLQDVLLHERIVEQQRVVQAPGHYFELYSNCLIFSLT